MKFFIFFIILLSLSHSFATETNGCGAQDLPDVVPDAPIGLWLATLGNANLFEESCNAHDICYGDPSIPQETCDQQFLADLQQACTDFAQNTPVSDNGIFYNSCMMQAQLYYKAVSELGYIAKNGNYDGKIASVEVTRIDNFFSDDEFEACINFFNNGTINGEYRVLLYGNNGNHIDTEPDTYWKDVITSQSSIICVGTEWIYESISDVGPTFRVELHEQNTGGMVDSFTGTTP